MRFPLLALALLLPVAAHAETRIINATIDNATTAGTVVNLVGWHVVGITTDAGINGTALTFKCATTSGGTLLPLKASPGGAAISYTVTTSSQYLVGVSDFVGCPFVQPVSGTSETGATVVGFVVTR
jgi:hypothetical protein